MIIRLCKYQIHPKAYLEHCLVVYSGRIFFWGGGGGGGGGGGKQMTKTACKITKHAES